MLSSKVAKPTYVDEWQVRSVDIRRIPGLTRDSFLDEYFGGLPVIIEGATDSWPLRSKWTFDYFKQQYGADTVSVSVGPRLASRFEDVQLKDYIAAIESGSAPPEQYMRQSTLLERRPELKADIGTCDYCDPARICTPYLWLGPRGTIQPFHKDNYFPYERVENIFVQCVGQKYIALVSPDHDDAMYQRSPGSRNSHFSQIEFQHAERERFPLFTRAVVREGIVKPGDALYIPAQTWHFVQSLSPSISLSLWWRSDDNG